MIGGGVGEQEGGRRWGGGARGGRTSRERNKEREGQMGQGLWEGKEGHCLAAVRVVPQSMTEHTAEHHLATLLLPVLNAALSHMAESAGYAMGNGDSLCRDATSHAQPPPAQHHNHMLMMSRRTREGSASIVVCNMK